MLNPSILFVLSITVLNSFTVCSIDKEYVIVNIKVRWTLHLWFVNVIYCFNLIHAVHMPTGTVRTCFAAPKTWRCLRSKTQRNNRTWAAKSSTVAMDMWKASGCLAPISSPRASGSGWATANQCDRIPTGALVNRTMPVASSIALRSGRYKQFHSAGTIDRVIIRRIFCVNIMCD